MYKKRKSLAHHLLNGILMTIIVINIMFVCFACVGLEPETNNTPPISEESEIVYTDVDLQDMIDLMNDYPMKAEDFKGTYIRVSGYLNTVDSDGSYFTIVVDKNAWNLMDDIKWSMSSNLEVQEFIKNTSKDTYITVEGKITSTDDWFSHYTGRAENVY